MPIIAIWWKPSLSGSVTPDDLEDAALDQAVRPRPDRRLGHAEVGRDLGERPAAVGLEVLDDPLVEGRHVVVGAAVVARDRVGRGRLTALTASWSASGSACGWAWPSARRWVPGVAAGGDAGDRHDRPGGERATRADRARRGAPLRPPAVDRRAWPGRTPVVGPHSIRMFSPRKAIGGSPLAGDGAGLPVGRGRAGCRRS